jgi:hypothetical protein
VDYIIGNDFKIKSLVFILLIVLVSTLGCTEDMNTASKAATVYANQGVIYDYNAYSAQYKIRVSSFNELVDDWNNKLIAYNDFIGQYNSMPSSKRTSSTIQNEKDLKASEVRSAGRNILVECTVFETHIDDMLNFMEANKDSIMKYDSQMYMQQKSFLVAQKTRCQATEDGALNVMNKIG